MRFRGFEPGRSEKTFATPPFLGEISRKTTFFAQTSPKKGGSQRSFRASPPILTENASSSATCIFAGSMARAATPLLPPFFGGNFAKNCVFRSNHPQKRGQQRGRWKSAISCARSFATCATSPISTFFYGSTENASSFATCIFANRRKTPSGIPITAAQFADENASSYATCVFTQTASTVMGMP